MSDFVKGGVVLYNRRLSIGRAKENIAVLSVEKDPLSDLLINL